MTEASRFTQHALSEWMKGEGPDSDIVISSRIRLARNIREYPFPMLATNGQSKEVAELAAKVLESEELGTISRFTLLPLADLDELQRRVLVEKHLISPALANESRNGAVILSDNESISIMVNEEDHLRIQCLCPGFQIKEAWDLAGQIDDVFETQLEYAFDEKRGYMTSCPTNVGTGIRASVMIHLPALVLTQQINRILSAITQVGLAVRGLYGEGSEALGNLFQISNQITLGQSEEEIIDNLYSVVRQIIEHERAARQRLIHETRPKILDRVSRSYGILSYAAIMDSKEAAQRLSDVRLGIDLGFIKNVSPHVLNELLVMTQPGFLQQTAGEKLTPEERDIRRAQLIREKISAAG
ncbi:protein arginine kinase [Paenibacillus mucilaginosus]|uniref:Protein-arginine kinase n=3 Tax=Paenibacillus mucilaginosus TaxID=61624 RepID=H6NSD0_9BACL|nr:protein arginine kinase [Paenibacillus mucilaginosus]AEI46048.1 Putative ATP:guanido phosphotransferase [Paenibacillus mucilaginosus KNP414]AFC33680.1 Putative ATP:guanido phosphotransferase [Paenibacillus mucilaginosus 3016]AFH66013.1 ATP:guanido phosphotransferase [Paenibacillus mucilaginosus K02]MCG7217724.1 protein arginine kinase [Paenibacillus mucilaginosus]WDM27394.1 protein arginine kinase [Paenibacillus mucilaginosus]